MFTGLTLSGMALSTGVVAIPDGGGDASAVTVPLYVYLYAGLGARGDIVTRLLVCFGQYTGWSYLEQLVGMAMRIPAAWILVTGIYSSGRITRESVDGWLADSRYAYCLRRPLR